MRKLFQILTFFFALAVSFAATPDPVLDSVRRADDVRVKATVAASREQLDAILSDGLIYTHSSGTVNDKASYLMTIVSGQIRYYSIEYESRDFESASTGIVLMYGRCLIHSANRGQSVENYLAYLAVWRQENSAWRCLAWQSCHLPPRKH